MQPKAKRTVIIVTSLVAIGSVVAYLLWKHKKDKNAEALTVLAPEQGGGTGASTNPIADSKPYISQGGGSGVPSSPSEIMKFQDWLDSKGIKWVTATNAALTNGKLLSKGNGYGNFGVSTQKAWAVYGADYLKLTTPQTSGFKPNDSLYLKTTVDNAFSYPSLDKKYVIGKIVKNGGNPVAKFAQNANTQGWIKASAIVTDYTWNDQTNSYNKSLKSVYLQAKNYTNVAP